MVQNLVTLKDVEMYIADFEGQYGLSTAEFLKNHTCHGDIPEDVVAEWLYLVSQLEVLRDCNRAVHEGYLDDVGEPSWPVDQTRVQHKLAA